MAMKPKKLLVGDRILGSWPLADDWLSGREDKVVKMLSVGKTEF